MRGYSSISGGIARWKGPRCNLPRLCARGYIYVVKAYTKALRMAILLVLRLSASTLYCTCAYLWKADLSQNHIYI